MQNPQNAPIGPTSGGPDTVSTPTSRAKAGASGMGHAAAEKIDEDRSAAAGGLDSAASALYEKANSLPGGESVKGAAHTAADVSSSTAEYVRKNGVKSMLADVRKLIKDNPGPVLLTAAVLGFLVARTFSRE
jgi:hypothetical protein